MIEVIIKECDFDLFIDFAYYVCDNLSNTPEEDLMVEEIDSLVEEYEKSDKKELVIKELSYFLNCELADLQEYWEEFLKIK